ncbi:agmatinase family protein [Compostibacter hankyongensis]|uniref:Agmatinase family protein n=1 Tax=Compostibacter hankyongensis TaxID=1007089 RepID=A0ABP8FP77_9BACT
MDLTHFDPNAPASSHQNIFGLPFGEEDARVVILPVPWEVTVSYAAGTARAPEKIFTASMQVDLYDADAKDGWKKGFFMRHPDKNILLNSDVMRKQAELYVHCLLEDGNPGENAFLKNNLQKINEGSEKLNQWVYEQTRALLDQGKQVVLLGGDHSTPLGYYKAIAEKEGSFGILHIDAHCDLREAYEDFRYSHASIMYNALKEVPALKKLVSVGIRDFCEEELQVAENEGERVKLFFDRDIKERLYEGDSWKSICDKIIAALPEKVYLSFDIDGLDPRLCPHTGTPVPGGLDTDQVFYLLKRMQESGRRLIGADLVEVGFAPEEWDANVGARVLFKLCNLLVKEV